MIGNHGRSPHGERGLKFIGPLQSGLLARSLPSRGAWIEMSAFGEDVMLLQSLPSRGAWIEIPPGFSGVSGVSSLPSRGAWIEISGVAST